MEILEGNTQPKRGKEITAPYFEIKGNQINKYDTYLLAAFIILLALKEKGRKTQDKCRVY